MAELLAPYPAGLMAVRVVGPKVNSAEHDGPECVEAALGYLEAEGITSHPRRIAAVTARYLRPTVEVTR